MYLHHRSFITGKCPDNKSLQWIMENENIVPGSAITFKDPEPGAEAPAKDSVRPGGELTEFYRTPFGNPDIIIDLNEPGKPKSSLMVYAIKMTAGNVNKINIFKKEDDSDADWTVVQEDVEMVEDEVIPFTDGERMGMLKIEITNGSDTYENEKFLIDMDIAICGSREF